MKQIIIRILKWALAKLEPSIFAPQYIYLSNPRVDYTIIEVDAHIDMDEAIPVNTNIQQRHDYLLKRAELSVISQICEKIKPSILLQNIEQPDMWRQVVRGRIIVGKFNNPR